MIVYPHVRDPGLLTSLHRRCLDDARDAKTSVATLLAMANVASFDHALGLDGESLDVPEMNDRYLQSVLRAGIDGALSTDLILVICGLGSYMRTDVQSLSYGTGMPRSAASCEPHVQKLWNALNEAVHAAMLGENDVSLELITELHRQLRMRRLVTTTFFGLRTLAELLAALLGKGDVTVAWQARERHILTMTARRRELYHPAGLLDLQALALHDVTTATPYRSTFVPVRDSSVARRAA